MRAGIYDKYNTGEGEIEKWKFQDIFLPLTLKPGDFGKITSTSHNKTFNSQNHKFKRAIYSNMFKRNKFYWLVFCILQVQTVEFIMSN